MHTKKRWLNIFIGPFILVLSVIICSNFLTVAGAEAIGISLWMIYWWITRPVDITITAIVPVVANAFLSVIPMEMIISQYSSDSIILIFGSGLITLPWVTTGLDRRISLKVLSLIGPSMKSQITVWLLSSIVLSNMMPNVAVCAMLTPIAVSMLMEAGYDDIKNCPPAVPILLAIGWGVTLGGAGSPLGGAMNITAISYLEDYIGHEFMYIDWMIRILPYLCIATVVLLIGMLMIPIKVQSLEGTKEFFQKHYRELGPMKYDEKICLLLFILAMLGAFARPVFVDFLPGLTPAYIFLVFGFLTFFIVGSDKKFLLTWEVAQGGTLWGMMFLFAGGLAMGKLLNESGASAHIAELITEMSLNGTLVTIIVFVVFARVISEVTNGTTAAAVCVPIVFSYAAEAGINPIPYWFITTMAFNAEYFLPLSVRAIPVAYGLDPDKLLKYGIPMTLINMLVVIIFGYFALEFWPAFSELSYVPE